MKDEANNFLKIIKIETAKSVRLYLIVIQISKTSSYKLFITLAYIFHTLNITIIIGQQQDLIVKKGDQVQKEDMLNTTVVFI